MTDSPWLKPDQLQAWMRLIAVVELLPGVLDSQLQHDAELTHFEYMVLAMLSEVPERTLRMTALSLATNSTLPRLSHVVRRLELRGYVTRAQSEADRRATNAHLTAAGWDKVVATAPGHVQTARDYVIDVLSAEQIRQLDAIARQMLSRLDPDGNFNSVLDRPVGAEE